jgi:hypothetical protein
VEEALTLWTHIQDSHDAYHDAIAQNTARLQRDKTIIVAQLRESLAEMKALSVEAFSKVQEQEDTRIELVSRIDELAQQIEPCGSSNVRLLPCARLMAQTRRV